jgi:hypothetical protein
MNIGICPICAKHITDDESWTMVEKVLGPFMVIPVIVHESHFSEPGWNWYGSFQKDSQETHGDTPQESRPL